MNFILYGADTFRSAAKLAELKNRFVGSVGNDFSYEEIGDDFTAEKLLTALTAVGFLSSTRLIVIRGLLVGKLAAELEDALIARLPELPKETVAIFYEAGLPKESPLFKMLKGAGHSQRFDPLNGAELTAWIKGYVESRGGQIAQPLASKLSLELGNDLARVSNELDKLMSFNPTISAETMELLVARESSASIFDLLNALSRKNRAQAVSYLQSLFEQGEAPMAILGMINKQIRDAAIVKDFGDSSDDRAIAAATSLHPFAVKKARELAGLLTKSDIAELFKKLEQTDQAIRRGETPDKLALNLLINSF